MPHQAHTIRDFRDFRDIREAFTTLRRGREARHRDIAEQLGISEGELIAAHAGASVDDPALILRATRLQPHWPEIIASLEPLGEVMALTRNASCVHEKIGVYRQASASRHIGLVLGGAIDLRIFYQHWAHGFAVTESIDTGVQQSLQFFDAAGTAIHKIFLKPQSDAAAYAALVADYADALQQPGGVSAAQPPAEVEIPDGEIDTEGFRTAWRGLRDTHDFFALLKTFGVTRTQGLRLADSQFAQRVDASGAYQILDNAARAGVPLMVFVGNVGMIQIHTGTVQQVTVVGPWINVLDPGFCLHLREDRIASAWVVKKPTVDGVVTSLELFDQDGQIIAMLFGERKPGKPELCAWRALIDALEQEPEPCAV